MVASTSTAQRFTAVASSDANNTLAENRLRTIVVAGVTSNAGKTSLAEAVIRVLERHAPTGAAKITVTHGERGCPHGGRGCNVCSSLGGEYQVIEKPSIIAQEGTDTARLKAAGANPVLWTITRAEHILNAWVEMQAKFKQVSSVVVESNTLAMMTCPSLTLMIVDPSVSRRLWKPSAEVLIAKADIVIFNDRGTDEKKLRLWNELEALRGTTRGIIKLGHPALAAKSIKLVSRIVR